MDPTTLAAAVIAALRPVLGADLDAGHELGGLYQAVRTRLARDTYHDTVLRGVEEQPDNDCRVHSLVSTLSEVAGRDPEFAAEIAVLLAVAAPDHYLQAAGN